MSRQRLCVAFARELGWHAQTGVQEKQEEKVLKVTAPMTPPTWALLEREVLNASSEACGMSNDQHSDENG